MNLLHFSIHLHFLTGTLFLLFFNSVSLAEVEKTESNSSSLTDLQLAKRDAEDFEKLAALIKPSIVVVEGVVDDQLWRRTHPAEAEYITPYAR